MPEPSCGKPELPGTLNFELIADPVIGSCCRASPRFVAPVCSMSVEWITADARPGNDYLFHFFCLLSTREIRGRDRQAKDQGGSPG
jgi:hypothetical protein